MVIFNLFIIVLLLFANAFFVASEFALVSVRQTRIQQLSNEGNKTAKIATNALTHLDRYIAATQLGITIASIGLGWVGEATLAKLIHPIFEFLPNISSSFASHSVATIIAFILITFMHVVIGELMPKSIALQFPEKTTLIITRPLVAAANILHPFIYLLNGFGNWALKQINISPAQHHHSVHTEEEIDMIIDESFKGGVLNETKSTILKNSLKFTDLMAKQVMVPRCNIVSIPINITEEEYAEIALENQYTRYPVYSENLDKIIGILHVKDLYSCQLRNQKVSFKDVLRPPVLVPETMTTDNLLETFKKNKTEIAVVIDEFGGVSGIVTMEDVLEEVVGSVQDEFDDEETDIKQIDKNKFIVNGLYRIEEFSEYFNLQQEDDEDVETIAGLVQKVLCRLAKINDEVKIENLKLKVIELKERRIRKILVERIEGNSTNELIIE